MKKTILWLLTLVLMTSLVWAAGSQNQAGQENQPSVITIQNQVQAQIHNGTYMNQAGEQMQIQKQDGNEKGLTLRVKDVEAHSEMNITSEQIQNKTQLKVQLSNGKNSEIKVMPNTASETAINRLQIKVCNQKNNCSIQLKEVGSGNQTRAAYEVQAQKQVKVLGLFKAQMKVQAQIDAESGEVVQANKPWWAILAKE